MTVSEYIGTLIAASSCAAGADILFESFEAETCGIGKYIKLIVSLSVVCAILLPFLSIFANLPSEIPKLGTDITSEHELSYSDSFILEETKRQTESKISEAIYEKFGIRIISADIEFHIDENDGDSEAVIDCIGIRLCKKDEGYAEKVRLFVSDGSPPDCVTVSIGGPDEQ